MKTFYCNIYQTPLGTYWCEGAFTDWDDALDDMMHWDGHLGNKYIKTATTNGQIVTFTSEDVRMRQEQDRFEKIHNQGLQEFYDHR